MTLTKKQADKFASALDELNDPQEIVDIVVDLGTHGESEDREDDTTMMQDALTAWLVSVAKVVAVAREVGLKAEVKQIQG